MATVKLTLNDCEMIDYKLETTNLPNHTILDYQMVTFKNGRGWYTPKTQILVVRGVNRNQNGNTGMAVSYTSFMIIRETLTNGIKSLIKIK
jgi:hypothetical protein